MHDFIQHLSFSPFPSKNDSGGSTTGAVPGRLTTAAPMGPLRGVLLSFNEAPVPSFRPSPRQRGLNSKIPSRKSKIPT
jgi:hypothetical protein